MNVLGLDISSSSTGWVLLKNGRFYKREDTDYGWIRPSKKFSPAEKLSFFRNELIFILNETMPDMVGIEDVFLFKNPNTMKLLSRFSGVACESVRTTFEIEPSLLKVSTIRSYIGTQVKSKKDTYKYLISKYKLKDWTFDTHNDITDALATAICVHKKSLEV